MRKLTVAIALVLVLAVAAPAVQGASHGMEDVDEDHWAYEAVEQLVAAGIVEGYPDGEYKGEQTMTRYEMAMIIQRTLDNINEDIDALEADVADLEDGLTAAQAADVTDIVAEMLEEHEEDGLSEQQAEEVADLVAALTAEFEEELDEMDAELGALEYTLETETDALWAETEGIYETIDSLEASIEELEEEDEQYEGSLTLAIDTLYQRLSPETTNEGTDYSLTFDHTHYVTDGFDVYAEWSPDETARDEAEGDVLQLNFQEEYHGVPGLEFSALHDDITSYNGHILDSHRWAHLQTTFDAGEELDLTLGLDWDYMFDNDNLVGDSEWKMAQFGAEGSVEMLDYGVDVIDFEDEDGDKDGTAWEVNLGAEDVVENLDLNASYYAYDEDRDGDYDEDYHAFEVGASYDIEDTRYAFHLDYANIEAGSWEFSDTTPTDHRHGYILQDVDDPDSVGSDGAQKISGQLDVDDVIGFDHYFLVEYWDTDEEITVFDSDQDDYYFEHGMERSLSEDTEFGLYSWYYSHDEDIRDDDGDFAVPMDDGEEDSAFEFEVFLEHELYSW